MNTKKTKTLSALFCLLVVAVIASFAIASPSFEIDTQSEPFVSNTTVTPATQDRGSSVIISSEVEDVSGINYARAQIKNSANTVVAMVNLYDDGAHNDGASGDDVYANSWTIPNSWSVGNYDVFIIASDTLGHIYNQKDTNFTVIVCVNGTTQSCGLDIGECIAGTKTCAGGTWGACVGETGPVAEICDGLDNDCDNSTDENLTAPLNSNQLGVCVGSRKTCNGITGWADDYSSVVNNEWPVEISCDGLDNDCDGTTDEGCACVDGNTQSCGSDIGECQSGIQTCSSGSWGACAGEITSSAEVCNDSKDNDCDNDTDCADSDCSGNAACVAATCPDGTCDVSGGECSTCAADCACLNLGDTGCVNEFQIKSVCCENAATDIIAGEICDVADGLPANMDLNGKTCNYFGYTGGTLGCRWDCNNYDPSSCVGVPATCGDNQCNANPSDGENCLNCPTECCPAGCSDFCFSEGYECGTQNLCGTPTDCGSCVPPATCNAFGKCIAPSLSVSIQSPINGLEFTSGDLVDFSGFVLGGTPDYIYEWSSDNEPLILSNERVFSSRNLSVNSHTITLKVTDSNALVSQDSVNITVRPDGVLSVRMILKWDEFFQSYGYFVGGSVVSGGTGAYSYQWNSNLAGDFSTDKLAIIDFSKVPAWPLGAHTITLTVTDGAGNTAQDTKIINVTDKTILSVYPNDGEHFTVGEPIIFSVMSVVGFGLFSATWESDLDGGVIGSSFSFQKNDLSIGLHTITLTVLYMSPSGWVTLTETFQIQINPVPTVCVPDWDCGEWSLCALGSKTRVCTDNNFCGVATGKPAEIDSCLDVSTTSAFDWRNNAGNWMTDVRSQGGCGSCWAFATLGAVEAKYNIQNNDLDLDENLSEQDLISCSYAGDCSGGSTDLAMNYLETVGINNEACFPYQYADASCSGKCVGWQNSIWNIDKSFLGRNMLIQTIKDRLINNGPLAVAMNNDPFSANSWKLATSGCLDDTKLNHAVVIVGYDDVGGHWIVRNSWGANWPFLGAGGYFKVLYGECGIETEVIYPNEVLNP